uniref:cell envelope integrity TolA C-terminal domain-containing protein n=1 Tax=Erwinia sp. E_sp_W01_6 TaxID=3039408 RepID=UPI00403F9FE6
MQAAAEKQCVTPQPGISKPDCLYTAKLGYGIQRNFYNASLYAGRECTLTIQYNDKGRYEVVSTEGDEVLCKKAWGVVSSADYLPPPPANLPKKWCWISNQSADGLPHHCILTPLTRADAKPAAKGTGKGADFGIAQQQRHL